MRIKPILFLLFLIFANNAFTQSLSVFTQTYSLSDSEREINDSEHLVKTDSYSQSFGVLLPINNLTLLTELVYNYSFKHTETIDNYYAVKSVQETPAYSWTNLKLGLGKEFYINNRLNYALFPYLGYSERPKTESWINSYSYFPNSEKLKRSKFYQGASNKTYNLGLKVMVNYRLLNQLFIGVAFDSYFGLIHVNDQTLREETDYGYQGEILNQTSYMVDTKATQFHNRFIQAGLFISYKFSKK